MSGSVSYFLGEARTQSLAVTLEVERTTNGEPLSTVCEGDKVGFSAKISGNRGNAVYSWSSSGGRVIGDGPNIAFDTTGLAPGNYTVTVEVREGRDRASDSKTIRVQGCHPLAICFNPNLDVNMDSDTVISGNTIILSTSVKGGRGFGKVTYSWSVSAGTFSGSGTSTSLDTKGVEPGTTIDVRVRATSEVDNCPASGSARVKVIAPPKRR